MAFRPVTTAANDFESVTAVRLTSDDPNPKPYGP